MRESLHESSSTFPCPKSEEEGKKAPSVVITMSGAGRKSKFRKGVTNDYLMSLPEPGPGEYICRVTGSRGANMFEIALSDDDTTGCLALLPNKFKNVIWVKTRDFVIVQGSDEEKDSPVGSDRKVQYLITHILTKEHIKHIQEVGLWPKGLTSTLSTTVASVAVPYGDYGSEMPFGEGEDEALEESDEEVFMDKMGNYITKEEYECLKSATVAKQEPIG